MTDSRVALGMDRLPWLPDEPVQPARPARPPSPAGGGLLGWVFAGVLLVAGAAYWVGLRSSDEQPSSISPRPEATFRLPDAAEQSRALEAPPPVAPKIEPIVAPPIPLVEAPRARREPVPRIASEPEAAPTQAETDEPQPAAEPAAADATVPAAPEAAKPEPARPVFTGPWPVRVVDGASGRLVRIGAFRSARQAKKGWWAIVKNNPAMKRLPALVVPVQSYRNGQVYYRLQMGTTSQAHSTVLCQRMRMIGQSCVVIDERRA